MAHSLADDLVVLGDIEYGARSPRVRQFYHWFGAERDEKFVALDAENVAELSERHRSVGSELEL